MCSCTRCLSPARRVNGYRQIKTKLWLTHSRPASHPGSEIISSRFMQKPLALYLFDRNFCRLEFKEVSIGEQKKHFLKFRDKITPSRGIPKLWKFFYCKSQFLLNFPSKISEILRLKDLHFGDLPPPPLRITLCNLGRD